MGFVLIKADVVRHPEHESKHNTRFVVPNLKGPPRHLYESIYCTRCDIQNRIKELHHGLANGSHLSNSGHMCAAEIGH